MNKEVIYLEPEDDITDILTKLQRAEQKVVALVPPKKATILRSAVNMKLVAKAAKESDKVAVVVTADPAILKLAMTAKVPIAKTLQSRPVVPTAESVKESESKEQIIDENLADAADSDARNGKNSTKNGSKTAGEASKTASNATKDKSAEPLELDEESLENAPKDAKKGSGKAQKKAVLRKKVPNFDKNRKKIIIGAVAGVLVIILLVWALVFAPAVDIIVAIHTSSNNFSENATFTTNLTDENLEEGKFYVEKVTFEQKQSAEFQATGKEDRGEKAKGQVNVRYRFSMDECESGCTETVPKGATFSSGGMNYVSTSDAKVTFTNKMSVSQARSECVNGKTVSNDNYCEKTASVSIEAVNPGAEFNIPANSAWGAFQSKAVSNPAAISGGSSSVVTVVSQADVNKAKEGFTEVSDEESKERLYAQVAEGLVPIESSFAVEVGDATSSPAVGQEADKATVSATTTYSVYVLEKSKLDQYIDAKATLADDQRIYSYGDPYIDRFTSLEEPARLKSTIEIGPTVTEEEILEKAKGKKIGELQSLLRSITGVSNVDIKSSFFWVNTVPKDANKIKVELTVEEN